MLRLQHPEVLPEGSAPRASSLLRQHGSSNEVERVYDEIFDAVMDRRLLPGAKLTEAALCRAFSCSRATVRTALAQLAQHKIVMIRPNRGAIVWQPGAKETEDVFEMRRAAEGLVIDKLIAAGGRRTLLEPLYEMVARERAAFGRGDRVSWIRLSNAFHVKMADLAGNHALAELMHSLCARSTIIIAHHDTPGEQTCSYIEHEQILNLLAAGDREGVMAAMNDHLLDCEHRIKEPKANVADPWAAFNAQI